MIQRHFEQIRRSRVSEICFSMVSCLELQQWRFCPWIIAGSCVDPGRTVSVYSCGGGGVVCSRVLNLGIKVGFRRSWNFFLPFAKHLINNFILLGDHESVKSFGSA